MEPEIVELVELQDIPKISLNKSDNKFVENISLNETTPTTKPHSVNFGGGVELLMNDKRRTEGKNLKMGQILI